MDFDMKSTDSLLQSDEHFLDRKLYPKQRRIWLQHCFSVILGLTPAFLVWLIMLRHSQSKMEPPFQTPFPDFPTESRTFEWNYTFTALRTPESEKAWKSLLPFGRGYVLISDPNSYSLPSGEASRSGQIYSVALYHQLHCLSIIRRDYFNLLEGVWNNDTVEAKEEAKKQIDNSHNRHCMDYIRQTLECHADMTIEWERTEDDGTRFQVDGMHIPHVCKKRSALEEFMRVQMAIVEKERMAT